MKIVVTGKGGVGKTTIAAILARTFARAENEVVAIDADPNPNLGIALGLGVDETAQLDAIANRLMREKAAHSEHEHSHNGDGTHSHPHRHKTPDEIVEEMGVTAPDGVRLVLTGSIERPADGCMCCGSHATTRHIFAEIDARDRIVIADLEAGNNDLIWAYPKAGDVVLVVTEPYRKSIEVARRALNVCRDLEVGRVLIVANRVADATDGDLVRRSLPDVQVVEIPDDPVLQQADRAGKSPLDTEGDSGAIRAIRELASRRSIWSQPSTSGRLV
ncbi:MAG TPA: ArsA-related P-loop ATPase [Actinomycetota bacterium]|jgi:CO dehydrogenase maturation factor|nr:ArsA-related P-loop ATPase [Actinomycetota bacterium]